jgi:hypothetical protein
VILSIVAAGRGRTAPDGGHPRVGLDGAVAIARLGVAALEDSFEAVAAPVGTDGPICTKTRRRSLTWLQT